MIARAVRVAVDILEGALRRDEKFPEVVRFGGEYCKSLKHLSTFVRTESSNGWPKSAAQIESAFSS